MTLPISHPLPADVEAFFNELRQFSKRCSNMALTEIDFEIARRVYHGETLQVIGDAVGLKKQSVARRKGIMRDSLQLWFFSRSDLEDAELLTYKQTYLRLR